MTWTANKTSIKALQKALNAMGYKGANKKKLTVDGIIGDNTRAALKAFQVASGINSSGKIDKATIDALALKGYKEGGLVDFTGLAKVDGTPKKPEAFLNAEQTKILRDSVLNNDDNLTGILTDLYTLLHSSSNSIIEKNTNDVVIEHVDIQMNIESIAGQMALDEILRIARKTGIQVTRS